MIAITINVLRDKPHGDTCLQLLVSALPRAACHTLIMSMYMSDKEEDKVLCAKRLHLNATFR